MVLPQCQRLKTIVRFSQSSCTWYSTGTRGSLPGRDVDHSPPPSAEVKKKWSYTSTLPVCLHDVHKDVTLCLSVRVIFTHFFAPNIIKFLTANVSPSHCYHPFLSRPNISLSTITDNVGSVMVLKDCIREILCSNLSRARLSSGSAWLSSVH